MELLSAANKPNSVLLHLVFRIKGCELQLGCKDCFLIKIPPSSGSDIIPWELA